MNKNSVTLLRLAALYGVVGAFLGAHMAGAGSYAFRAVHAHILVVGWLTLFGWAVFYKVFHVTESLLTKIHISTAIIGSLGLTIGMWLYMVKPFELPEGITLAFYIGGGALLLVSFIVFFLITVFYRDEK
ncbi:hypothetical protein [Ornithinibacillus californiensis]|uniref:hypothetical protein n=1 Tax=Ornithinibacillus californiensis TaxID=161536 RepID=UPI00064D89F3|nr:hypothetical protein [Ornithinibacillus californiensis]